MITFSLNDVSGSGTYAAKVWSAIQNNLGYFKSFNADRWEEAVQRTYMTALQHQDGSYSDITPYIKKLARTILKEKQNERAFGVYTDDGEISPVYYSLKDYINTDNLDGSGELIDTFKELYLLDPDAFMKLKTLFLYNDVTDIENLKNFKIRSPQFNNELRILVTKYGSDYTFRALYSFFGVLPSLIAERKTGLTKEINLKQGDPRKADKIPDTPTIVDSRGNYHSIDKTTLTMSANPDYFKWDIIGSSMCDILKVDLSPFINYMYEEIFVEEGVSTKHIKWCGNKYRLTSPGGAAYIGLDLDKFISMVRIELLLNLVGNNLGSVVAVSTDSLYIKPTRAFQYDNIRIKTQTGKIIDLPITVHIKKRR